MPTSVTISIPVTVHFDGCFCSESYDGKEDCSHLSSGECDLGDQTLCRETLDGCGVVYIRTRWCCEAFGMGEAEPTEHEIWTNIDGSIVDLTHNAIDNETLRRWTFDE